MHNVMHLNLQVHVYQKLPLGGVYVCQHGYYSVMSYPGLRTQPSTPQLIRFLSLTV